MPTNHWILSDQAAIDRCADDLLAAGFASDVHRQPEGGIQATQFTIHIPGKPLLPQTASVGMVIVMPFGEPIAITQAQWEASPFYEPE